MISSLLRGDSSDHMKDQFLTSAFELQCTLQPHVLQLVRCPHVTRYMPSVGELTGIYGWI